MVKKNKRPGVKIPEGILNEPKYLYMDLLKVTCGEVRIRRGGSSLKCEQQDGETQEVWGEVGHCGHGRCQTA